MRLKAFSAVQGDPGNQDMQMAANAILPQLGQLTIRKVTVGGDATFNYTASGAGVPPVLAAFSLTTVGGIDEDAYANVPAGVTTVAESMTLPTGWNFTSLVCTGDLDGGNVITGRSVAIDLDNAENQTCTFTNTANATLTLNKIIDFNNGGTATEADWTLTANGTGSNDLSGPGTSGSNDVTGSVLPDTFALSESAAPAGYTNGTTYSCVKNGGAPVNTNSITLALGDTAVCSITNTDNAPSLTLNKIVVNNNGGTAVESDWTLTADGGAAGTLSGPGAAGNADVVSGAGFDAGTYALSESAGPAGYTNGATYSCVKNGGAPVNTNSITLALGDVAVCSITNTDDPASITIVKHCDPVDATNGVFSFTWTHSGPQTGFDLGCQENPTVSETKVIINPTMVPGDLGTYTFTETPPAAGSLFQFDSVSCVGDSGSSVSGSTATVQLNLGENVVCTFNNIAVPEQRFTGGGSFYPNFTDRNPQFPSDLPNGEPDPGNFTLVRITHGFTLHCNPDVLPNRLEVNWAGTGKGRKSENNFHLTSLENAQCYDDPDIDEQSPVSGVDTYEGWGLGDFNNVSGFRAHWIFTDAGEPGVDDEVWIVIEKVANGNEKLRIGGAWDTDGSDVPFFLLPLPKLDLLVPGDKSRLGVDGSNIDVGNQQAHKGS
jgi:hypothetical protein